MDPQIRRTTGSSGTLIGSDDRKLSTMVRRRGPCLRISRVRLEPTNPAPPTTRIFLPSNVSVVISHGSCQSLAGRRLQMAEYGSDAVQVVPDEHALDDRFEVVGRSPA